MKYTINSVNKANATLFKAVYLLWSVSKRVHFRLTPTSYSPCPWQESNLYLLLRRELFYPLNYKSIQIHLTSIKKAIALFKRKKNIVEHYQAFYLPDIIYSLVFECYKWITLDFSYFSFFLIFWLLCLFLSVSSSFWFLLVWLSHWYEVKTHVARDTRHLS